MTNQLQIPTLSRPVTAMMPAYNAQETIEATIRSILNQSYEDWDLLIIDDGSTDNTRRIAESFALSDPRIHVMPLPHVGMINAVGLGVQAAHGRWVARLDSDDLWHPAKLERQMEYLAAHPRIKVLGTWGERINDQGERLSSFDIGPASVAEYQQWKAKRQPIFMIHSSIVVDREVLLAHGGYQAAEYPGEDLWLWTRIAQNHPVVALPENLMSYRINAKGVSSLNYRKMFMQTARLRYCLKHGDWPSQDEFDSIRRGKPLYNAGLNINYLHQYYFRTGAGHLFNRRRMRGAFFLALSACANPFQMARRVLRGA